VELAFRKTTYNEFATEIEKAHGWVHGIIGGGWTDKSFRGHMWPLEYSSYEPLFWIHHA
jgi:tyrosinase